MLNIIGARIRVAGPRAVRGLCAVSVAAAVGACTETATQPRSARLQPAQLALSVRVGAGARSLKLSIGYKSGGNLTALLDQTIDVGAEARAVPVSVDIGPCLSDPQHEAAPASGSGAPGCVLHITATLLGASNESLDVATLPPITVHQGESASAALALGTHTSFVSLALGAEHSCRAITTTGGGTKCWGSNSLRQLAGGSGASPDFRQIVSGINHTCGLTPGGNVSCWGLFGNAPVDVTPISSPAVFTQISAGSDFTCAVSTDGTAYCWGLNNLVGSLGDGTLQAHSAPAPVKGHVAFTRVAAGAHFACGLTAGPVYCWGTLNINDPSQRQLAAPEPLAGTDVIHVAALATGSSHVCGMNIDGLAVCYGTNGAGQLGDGTHTAHFQSPAIVAGNLHFVALTAGTDFTCGIATDGFTYCWGNNTSGQLGDGTTTSHASPARISADPLFATIVAGANHICGATSGGAVYCWGSNHSGQLGDGTTVNRAAPTLVRSP